MGMFDYIRSSYNLGVEFTNVELHTKDIEEGIGGTMSQYWLDPAGHFYYIDYSHTADFVQILESDKDYDPTHLWCNFKWVSNGNKGKITPWLITKYIEVYPSKWEKKWQDWPRLRLHFRHGILQDYTNATGR